MKSSYVGEQPILKMKARLNRHTKYWPLTISSTFIFNLKTVKNKIQIPNKIKKQFFST